MTGSTIPRLSTGGAALLTFTAAACVLVLEIAAGRLLAPYVGVSLTTYTGIIGVILGGIALGAWAGGRLADRVDPERLVGPTFVLGGLATILAVPIVATLGETGVGGDISAIVGLATAGFVVPATILSAVAPMIVRATLVDVRSSGAVVGRLSAIGTAGAISGTFLTGFVLLGSVPTRSLIVGTGVLLVLVGLAVAWRVERRLDGVALGLAAVTLLSGSAAVAADPCDRESAYYCIAVVSDDNDPDGRTLILDGLRHAHVALDDPTDLEFRYIQWFAALVEPELEAHAGSVDVLHVGGGGFTFPRYLAAVAPPSRHTVLELDPTVLAVAREDLAFAADPRITVVLGDARLSIEGQPTDAFDVVVGDAFGGLSVPWHLTTAEFLGEIDRVMRPGGRYVMNLIDGPSLRFVRAEAATLRGVFEHVVVVGTPSTLAGEVGGNVVLAATHVPLDVADLRAAGPASGEFGSLTIISGRRPVDEFVAGVEPLRDDFAPVDQLIGR